MSKPTPHAPRNVSGTSHVSGRAAELEALGGFLSRLKVGSGFCEEARVDEGGEAETAGVLRAFCSPGFCQEDARVEVENGTILGKPIFKLFSLCLQWHAIETGLQ
mmetsp:Transcript_118184/g.164640  ORF Transcript_118184/g.164640 Transcript_118184/m.164640 type:complete len:105 (-) Transcript_118184:33-347(-)